VIVEVDDEEGAVLSGAEVTAFVESDDVVARNMAPELLRLAQAGEWTGSRVATTIDGRGRLSLPLFEWDPEQVRWKGTYRLNVHAGPVASAPEIRFSQKLITVAAGEVVSVVIQGARPRYCHLSGTIRSPQGHPTPLARLVQPLTGAVLASTDASGVYVIESIEILEGNVVEIMVEAAGCRPVIYESVVPTGATALIIDGVIEAGIEDGLPVGPIRVPASRPSHR
jgi:hypothetical protein